MHGLAYATEAVRRADVIVAVGTRFTDRATGSYGELVGNAKIVQLDIDPAEIDKNVTDAAYLVGDIRSSLETLVGMLEPRRHADWRAEICRMRELSDAVSHAHEEDEPLNPYSLIDTVARYTARYAGRHRRRAASDVGRAAIPAQSAPRLHHERRARHDGLSVWELPLARAFLWGAVRSCCSPETAASE